MAKVVVVDDQDSARNGARGVLTGIHDSIEVIEFRDAEEALGWCCSHPFDLLLLDYRMPGIDGITFVEQMRESATGLRAAVMMVTAQGDDSIRRAALQAGVHEFLVKPVSPLEFKCRISNLLQLFHARSHAVAAEPAMAGGVAVPMELAEARAAALRGPGSSLEHSLVSARAVVEAVCAALKLGVNDSTLAVRAAEVYDLGMVLVPETIYGAARSLSDAEKHDVEAHCAAGHSVLAGSDPQLAQVVLCHHERYNGSGYPQGLIGTDIPMAARVLAVADAFCSMVSARPHRPAFRVSEAIARIGASSGVDFDPACVDALVSAVPDLVGVQVVSLPPRADGGIGEAVR